MIRIAKHDDLNELIRLTMTHLPEFYDGCSPEFAKSLLKTHLREKDDYGFFSTKKLFGYQITPLTEILMECYV